MQYFGEGVPFGDPYWYQGFASPYYNASHIAYRAKCRKFVEDEILPYADEWSRGDGPGYPYKELHPKGYQAGVLGVIYPPEFGGTVPEGGSGTRTSRFSISGRSGPAYSACTNATWAGARVPATSLART